MRCSPCGVFTVVTRTVITTCNITLPIKEDKTIFFNSDLQVTVFMIITFAIWLRRCFYKRTVHRIIIEGVDRSEVNAGR